MTLIYYIIDHTADFGLQIFAPDMKTLFESSALALFAQIFEPAEENTPGLCVSAGYAADIKVDGINREDLLVNWLRELLYLYAGKNLLVTGASVQEITDTALQAEVRVTPYEPDRHRIKTEIKAVTYHRLGIKESDNGFTAEVFFDV